MRKISKILIFSSIIFVFFFLFGGKKIFQALTNSKKGHQYFALVSEITELIKTRYVDMVDPSIKFPGAYSSLVTSLDKFSAYLSPKQSKIYKQFQDGSAFSLGIYGRKYQNYFHISDVMSGSPAQKAGLENGDIIHAVNEKNLTALSFWEIFLSFYTEKPEEIDLVIKKVNSKKNTRISLQTEKLAVSPIIKKFKGGIVYVSLMRIDYQTVQFLQEIMKKNHDSKWIFDLRKYSGGDFESFIFLTRLLVYKKIPIYFKTKDKSEKFIVGSDISSKYKGLFIIDASTILYSELLAFFLKNTNNILIGSKTPGFLPRLQQFFLQDGSSILLTLGYFRYQNLDLLGTSVIPHFQIKKNKSENLIQYCLDIFQKNQ